MASVFADANDVRMISGGTDNHLILLDIQQTGHNGKEIQDLLDSVDITLNKNQIVHDPFGPFKTAGVRIGTPAITTRGFKVEESREVAHLVLDAIRSFDEPDKLAEIKERAHALTAKFPLDYEWH